MLIKFKKKNFNPNEPQIKLNQESQLAGQEEEGIPCHLGSRQEPPCSTDRNQMKKKKTKQKKKYFFKKYPVFQAGW